MCYKNNEFFFVCPLRFSQKNYMKVTSPDWQTIDIVLIEQLAVSKSITDVVRVHWIRIARTRNVSSFLPMTPVSSQTSLEKYRKRLPFMRTSLVIKQQI